MLRYVVALALLATLGFGAYRLTDHLVGGSDTAVAQPADPSERDDRLWEEDRRKPRFTGQLGDFEVVGPLEKAPPGYFCPEPTTSASYDDVRNSDLYFDVPGARLEGAGACRGRVVVITVGMPNGAIAGRAYFNAARPQVPADAPKERLKLTTVAGKPALIVLPIAGHTLQVTDIVVIERSPTATSPGIAVWAHAEDVTQAVESVEQILRGVRQ